MFTLLFSSIERAASLPEGEEKMDHPPSSYTHTHAHTHKLGWFDLGRPIDLSTAPHLTDGGLNGSHSYSFIGHSMGWGGHGGGVHFSLRHPGGSAIMGR